MLVRERGMLKVLVKEGHGGDGLGSRGGSDGGCRGLGRQHSSAWLESSLADEEVAGSVADPRWMSQYGIVDTIHAFSRG